MKTGDYLHKEHPKTCEENDFWAQVSRTVNGVPVSQAQIDMIIHAISSSLNFSASDHLLDIGCGNGALSQYFFSKISKFQGVDFSEYLIDVAKKHFENPPAQLFTKMDAVTFVETENATNEYTKALCYGAFTYFSLENAKKLLSCISKRYPNIDLFFIGNLPDKELSEVFTKDKDYTVDHDDSNTPIGIWRSRKEFQQLADETGWEAEFSVMPEEFYSSHYRYDVLLKRK